MATADSESNPAPQVVFRTKKKAKPYRQHTATTVENLESSFATANASELTKEEASPAATSAPAASGIESTSDVPAAATSTAQDKKSSEEDEEDGLSVTELLKLRNARKHKLAGVGFRATDEKPSATGEEQNNMDGKGLVVRAAAGLAGSEVEQLIGGITKRFAPQTGFVGDLVNRHMEEYVESELAKRKRLAAEASARQQQQEQEQEQQQQQQERATRSSLLGGSQLLQAADPASGQGDAQRVLHGKLFEIDLGDEARARNIEMTERARRRLQGLADDEMQNDGSGSGSGSGSAGTGGGLSKKPRLGKGPRNRRGSDDIQRDQMVEAFLSENKLDVYDIPSQDTHMGPHSGDEDEGAADDRIAEEFRREFMEAMAQRHRRRRPAQNAAKPGAKGRAAANEPILRGPKLGGSRNARAAMRDLLLKEQAQKQAQKPLGRR